MGKLLKVLFFCTFLFVFGLFACGEKKDEFKDVVFNDVPDSINEGRECEIGYVAEEGVELIWESTDPSVAVVENGKITALLPGKTTIVVTAKMNDIEKEYTFDIVVIKCIYSITYVNMEGASYPEALENPSEYDITNLPILLTNPVKKGYKFLGWSLEENGEFITELAKDLTGDITLYANFKEDIVYGNISYELDGAVLPADALNKYVVGNETILPIPSKEGYTFLGWSFDEGDTSYIEKILATQTGDVTLYANWEVEKVYGNINYILDGGRLPEHAPEMYVEGTKLVLLEPTKADYVFLGWSLKLGDTSYITEISASQKGDITLYANWSMNTDFVIKYNYEEGNLPSKPASTFEEMDAAFWPVFQAWCKDKGDLTSFKNKVLSSWKGGKDGGYKLFLPGGLGQKDANYFVNDPEVDKFWYDWFVVIDEQITDINKDQSAWGSAYVGYLRLNALFTGNTSLWTTERRAKVYEKCLCKTPLITEYTLGDEFDLVDLVIDDGRTFLGWYDDNGKKVDKITKDMKGNLNLTAMWSASTPAESFELTKVERLGKLEEYQLSWVLLPNDTTNKNIIFESSNPSILSIDKHAVMHGHKEGIVTVTYTVLANPDLSGSFEVAVYVDAYIDAKYETTSVVTVGESIKINAEVKSASGKVVWDSSDKNVATVDKNGNVTGVSSGFVTITASMDSDSDVKLELGVTVLTKEEADFFKIFTNAHNAEVYYVPLLNVAYDYDTSVACSVSDLLFNWEYKVNDDYFITPNRKKMSSIEFITVHYSGMPLAHQDGEIIAKALYNGFHGADWGGTSWHYSTGNDGIFHSMDETKVAWHAGDGTSVPFKWINTGVKATSNTKPVFKVVANSKVKTGYSFSVNGVVTDIEAPQNSRLTFYGPTWKIENGYYYMGNVYYSSSYGYISSRGGNLNSIGIESACNYGSDLWLTYHYTAQLVARLLDRHNLDISRVQGHHTFSGKDCPQTLLEGNGELWYKFIELVEAELALYQLMQDYTITCEVLDSDLVEDNGRVKEIPNYTDCVTYKLTIKNNKTNEIKELKLSSVIHGMYTL